MLCIFSFVDGVVIVKLATVRVQCFNGRKHSKLSNDFAVNVLGELLCN